VYFVSTRRFTDQKWGTRNPVMMEDPQYGPVFLRAFGTYVFRVVDPGKFVKNVVGTDGTFTVDEIDAQLRNLIVTRFSHSLPRAVTRASLPKHITHDTCRRTFFCNSECGPKPRRRMKQRGSRQMRG